MDELQLLLRAVLGLLRKGAPALLRRDTGVADLLIVLDHRHATHHGLLAELVQRLEVEMTEPFVPAPGFVVLPRGEVEWLRGLKMEDEFQSWRACIFTFMSRLHSW
jgi:hypothetical protein